MKGVVVCPQPRAADAGAAVLVYSTDLDEVLSLGDRLLVAAGGIVTEAPAGISRAALGALMLRTDSRDAE